jgi:hypothetical protein
MNDLRVLQHLGFVLDRDFVADFDGIRWLSSQPQPTPEEIEAAAPAAAVWWARRQIRPVTRRQMLTALHRAGLKATIDAAVAASGDIELQIAYAESQEFQRDNPFLAQMAQALDKTDEEIDAIFALAATI